MGSNGGNGVAGDVGGMQQGNGSNRPPATEYTLQGVMRFLQTEWHRHERDRNSWEIERQEMKARIAQLEGKLKRGDATQNASKKYIKLLEKKIKDQAAHLKAEGKWDPAEAAKFDREARSVMIQEKLNETKEGGEGGLTREPDRPEDENNRKDLKSYLDQCQNEFTYLMITPANPQPPRESPPPPMLDELPHEGESFNIPVSQQQQQQQQQQQHQFYGSQARQVQNHVRELNSSRPPPTPVGHGTQNQVAANFQSRSEAQSQSMGRSGAAESQGSAVFASGNEWPTPASVTARLVDENAPGQNHGGEGFSVMEGSAETGERKSAVREVDGWDFTDAGAPPSRSISNRPDTDVFPSAESMPKSPNRLPNSHRRKGSMSRRRSAEHEQSLHVGGLEIESGFKLRYGLRGHLDTVRSVIFSGGGSPAEPEICTGGDDGMIKRFHVPRLDGTQINAVSDLDVTANFTHRGHTGAVLSLAAWSPSPNFSTGGRAQGDGWIFSGGQDTTIRVWERGRVDPKATLDGHDDAVWALCVLPGTLHSVMGTQFGSTFGSGDRILLVSGAADGVVKVWAISAPPQLSSPQPGASQRRPTGSAGRVRGNSMSSGSGFSTTPQASTASNSPFHHNLIHNIARADGSKASPTCITPLSPSGDSFVVAYSDAAILVYDTRTAEQIGSLASLETYDGTGGTSVNAVVATTAGLDQHPHIAGHAEEETAGGPTGGGKSNAGSGVEGVIISGHEDRFVRFFDANSGQCTYSMMAHAASISSLSLSPDGRELVTAGHDASLKFWDLEKRACTQETAAHRVMRGEGICAVVWSQDGKWVVSGGGDGVIKVFMKHG